LQKNKFQKIHLKLFPALLRLATDGEQVSTVPLLARYL
jgi:hypothetical protein